MSANVPLAPSGVMDFEEIVSVVAKVRYKDWRFRLSPARFEFGDWGPVTLRIEFAAADAYNSGSTALQTGRPWLLEPRSHSELLQTVWLAIITAEEHEARETFSYAGRKVFNPHKNHLLGVSI